MTITALHRQDKHLPAPPESDELVIESMGFSTCYSEINDLEFRRILNNDHSMNQKKSEVLR